MIIRVGESGKPAFQLRKGEKGLSAFDTELVDPLLTDDEITSAFRTGSILVLRTKDEITTKGLIIEEIEGAETLPIRLRLAHVEIRSGPNMDRAAFKRVLSELE